MSICEALSRTLLLARDSDLVGANTLSDEQFVKAFLSTRVLLVADEANLSVPSGQHALVTLIDLIARLGVEIRLALPELPTLGFQPPLRGKDLRAGLLELGSDLLPGCLVTVGNAKEPANIVFILGDSAWEGQADIALRLCGDSWSGWTVPASQNAKRWVDSFPVGGLTAAGIAAPEVFKYALRILGSTLPHPVISRFLAQVGAARVCVAPPDTATGPFALGKIDFVSGGAIAHATLYTLLHLPEVTAAIRVIEPECYDLSNLNRYMLLRHSECGIRKIDTLYSWRRPGVTLTGVAQAYTDATSEQLEPFASQVIVGTDDIPARWAVQRARPAWLGVGATSHFFTVTSSHTAGQACAGCLHPEDDPGVGAIPTISFVSYWAGFLLAIRLLRHSLGHAQMGSDQSIWCTPLRLDQPRSYWPRPIPINQQCPVQCQNSRMKSLHRSEES
jgi:hypothetical protein